MHTELSSNKLTARVSKDWCQLQQKFLQHLRSPQKLELGLLMPANKIFVIEINEWCDIYNYCYTKVFTELSVFQFSCIITCVTWRSLTSKMVDRFNLTWNIPIVNVLQHHLSLYCKRKNTPGNIYPRDRGLL